MAHLPQPNRTNRTIILACAYLLRKDRVIPDCHRESQRADKRSQALDRVQFLNSQAFFCSLALRNQPRNWSRASKPLPLALCDCRRSRRSGFCRCSGWTKQNLSRSRTESPAQAFALPMRLLMILDASQPGSIRCGAAGQARSEPLQGRLSRSPSWPMSQC